MDAAAARSLAEAAVRARERAYAPYSGFKVGAALLAVDGTLHTGCNVENAAYAPSVCAERVAICKAVSEGARAFAAVAVAGWKDESPGAFAFPCGVCRQAMREFCDPEAFEVIVTDGEDIVSRKLSRLLPDAFGPENISKKTGGNA